jgi:hypothetical protein
MTRSAGALTITEAEFQSQVIDLAHLFGWTVAHFRPALTSKGWRTPVQADGAGYPDLTLVRPPRVVFVELKSADGKLTDRQRTWLDLFGACPGVRVELWRPADWDAIVAALR